MEKVRITVILEGEIGQKVLATAKEQKRSKSAMAAIMLEDWYKAPGITPIPVIEKCEHDFQALNNEGNTGGSFGGNYRCTKCGARI